MFAESEDIRQNDMNKFQINRKYEQKFLKKQKRAELERAKRMYGKNWEKHIDASDQDSGSELEEDEDAELFNDQVSLVLNVLLKKFI